MPSALRISRSTGNVFINLSLPMTASNFASNLTSLTTLLAVLGGMALFPLCAGGAETGGDPAPALVLFVDANSGDDANDGSTKETPLRTLQAAQSEMDEVPNGEVVVLNLARGSEWRESYDFETYGRKRYPAASFGRDSLTIRAYGEGDKPTISGLDPMSNKAFVRHDPERYPNVWSQRLTPPPTYTLRYLKNFGHHPGVIVNREQYLAYVWATLPPENLMRDQKNLEGINSEEDALAFVNEHPGSFYPRHNEDGTADYFINSGSDPTKDGRTYEYRVRGDFFIGEDNTWEGIRFIGNTNRDGLGGNLRHVKDVEFLHGITHNMLIGEGHFEDVLSAGLPRPTFDLSQQFGVTGTAFHTHRANSRGIVYDRCTARNVTVAFFDHRKDANRPAAVVRDCVTENVRTAFNHSDSSTVKFYIVGHRHQATDGSAVGEIGSGALENYIEDSLFRVDMVAGWHGNSRMLHLRLRNSVIYMPAGKAPLAIPAGADYEYDYSTLILDFGGRDITAREALLGSAAAGDGEKPAPTVTFRNSVIAVINAPNAQTASGKDGLPLRFFKENSGDAGLRFENCVLTFMEGIPDSAGVEGKDYVFADPADIFAGDPGKGDYSLKPGGAAAKRDAGYVPGRTPVFRPLANEFATSLPFVRKP